MSPTTTSPDKITGGCLCGSIRYELRFNEQNPWPPLSQACQCTMCRKFTGCLFPQMLSVDTQQFNPPLASNPEYREFQSSPGRYRGFCMQCSSPLIWRMVDRPEHLSLLVGSIDEKWLIGERVKGSERETPYGVMVDRHGGLGKELCLPNGINEFYENVIPGVTDVFSGGQKFLTDASDGFQPLP